MGPELVELIYEESEDLVNSDTDIASYRIIKTNNAPKAKFVYTKIYAKEAKNV